MGTQELNLIKEKSKSLSWKTEQCFNSKLSMLQKIPLVKLNFLSPPLERSATIDCSRDFKFQSMKRKKKPKSDEKSCKDKELVPEKSPEMAHLEGSLLQRVDDLISPKGPFLCKGLLWQKSSGFLQHWQERFFILTQTSLHSFKRPKPSENFKSPGAMFSLLLSDIEEACLCRKGGQLLLMIGVKQRMGLSC